MEKRTPHAKLSLVRELIRSGSVRATRSAYEGALELGITNLAGMCAVVMTLTPHCFCKSMTTHADHRVWQDVYHAKASDQDIYLKLTVVDDVLIVSFKEL
ncbi:type II toxin-antitoxin system MqsR family toxin [Ralstonia sp. Ralssp135]|uniref:type II toxin-antitoxin system MqsR family toxin n=1 Tax=Ralstonia sp. Ralssp135 TaxID=3243016 RepID=UPI0039B0FED7